MQLPECVARQSGAMREIRMTGALSLRQVAQIVLTDHTERPGHADEGIPLCLDNPKIGRVYNAEVVGDRIAEDRPVFRHLRAQEMQNGSAELIVGRVAAVVGHVSMHQSPQALDRIEVRAVARNVMDLDPAPWSCQPLLNEDRVMIPGIVKK